MKARLTPVSRAAFVSVCFLLLHLCTCLPVAAQGTAFTYQGHLNDGVNPATGIYDLKFTVFDSTNNPGVLIAGPLTNAATAVSNGWFAVTLDFGGGVFTGPARWLEVAVRTNGAGVFANLAPRQPVLAAPYAIFANSASNLVGTLSSGQLSGTYSGPVNFNNGANEFDGTFTGQFFGSIFTGGLFTGTFLGSGSGLGDVWHTGGNLGTTAGVNFLGTSDNQPLEMRVNNQRVLRLEPANDINVGSVPNVIGGHKDNSVSFGIGGAVIAGGGGPGLSNAIASTEGVIAGGYLNRIEAGNAHASAIGGGFDNAILASSSRAVIAGGHANRIFTNSQGSVISGGEVNYVTSNANWATVGGGIQNVAAFNFATVGGGVGNYAHGNINGTGDSATVAGGYFNAALGNNATVAGGAYNLARGDNSAIPGGFGNAALSTDSVIGGGYANTNQGNEATIGGGDYNWIQPGANGSVIGGGSYNLNRTNASGAITVGGFANTNGALNTFIGGGVKNLIQPGAAQSVIGGGSQNLILSGASHSTIPGGYGNIIAASNSFAAGSFAQAANSGSFVWSDNSSSAYFSSSDNNQFLVRAQGGLFFSHGPAGVNLDYFNLNNGDLNYGLKFGFGSGEGIASKRTAGGNQYGLDFYTLFLNRMSITQNGNVGIGTNTPSTNLHVAGTDINGSSVKISTGGLEVEGLLRSGTNGGTSELPSPSGLVVRRINSTSTFAGQVVARTDLLTLERDGSNGGFLIRYPAFPGNTTIACMGINSLGAQVNSYNALPNPAAAGVVQLYFDAQNIVHFECTFGQTFLSGQHLTRVTLSRFAADNFWSGDVVSTYNQ